MQEAIEIATELMDKKIRSFAERETNTGRVYTASSGGKKQYEGSKPLCAKYNYHHDGPCAPKCHNCNKIGHSASDCRSVANTNNAKNQRGTELGQKPTCYECGVRGHFRRECPKLKNNNNHDNQGGRNNAPARVYAVGHAGADPDANVVTVLDIPCEGACVFTVWSLDELAYGVPTDGPYQTNPPSPDDIISAELLNESYVLYDRAMNPLTAKQERNTRKDHGTRRGRHSTSSSSAFDQPSSSHLNDDDDGNDEGTSHASTASPTRFVNSLTNDVP
nr:hypothetical protein [Tanacetum cinerariifolium]